MGKTVFIIPGSGQRPDMPHYFQIGELFEKQGITPAYININWRMRQSIEDCAEEAEGHIRKVLEERPHDDLYFFGFSIGAMVAHILSAHYEAKAQVLCSMSPFFKEDIEYLPFHTRLISSFIIYPGSERPKYPNPFAYKLMDTYWLIGDREGKYLNQKIITQRQNLYPEAQLLVIQNARHDISGKDYMQAIADIISRLGSNS